MPISQDPELDGIVDPDVTAADLPASPHPVVRTLRDRWDVLLAIAAGGALGSLARWGTSLAVPHDAGHFAWSTWIVNVLGALLIGVLMVLVIELGAGGRYLRPFVGVGILGGFTTFSTYMLDTRDLLAHDRPLAALGYVGSTLLVGLAAVYLGMLLSRGLLRLRHRLAVRRRERARPRSSPPTTPPHDDTRRTP